MRKNILVTICVIMLAIALTACGSGQTAQTTNESMDTRTDAKVPTDKEETVEGDKKSSTDFPVFHKEANVEETVIYDENDVKVTATELKYTNSAVVLNLIIENNGDKTLSFTAGTLGYACNSVNGYMVDDGYLNADVAAGKKANEAVKFNLDELMLYGMNVIADIQVGIEITDADFNSIYTGPCQVKTTVADSYDYSEDTYITAFKDGILESVYGFRVGSFSENEIFNQSGVRIVSEAFITNKDGEQTFLIEIINDTDKLVYGVTSDVAVNGLGMYSSTWSSNSINSGCRRICDLPVEKILAPAYWEKVGLKDIGEISFDFSVKDENFDECVQAQKMSIKVPDGVTSFDNSGEELFDESGIRIVSKGLVADSSDYSGDVHFLLLVENTSSKDISIDDIYDSLSVNGFMTDYIVYSHEMEPNSNALLDIEIQESSLKDNGISGVAGIEEVEISFEIKGSNYETIAEPKLTAVFK